jgi:1-deoxy-D-xylulose-5-phosphate reductoisomerase
VKSSAPSLAQQLPEDAGAPRAISVLGSTGSVGTQVLDVVRRLQGRVRVHSLSGGSNIALLAEQAREFRPEMLVAGTEQGARELESRLTGSGARVLWGDQGLAQAASAEAVHTVVVAVQGFAGLAPTLAAARTGKSIGIASKEVLVAAGPIVREALNAGGAMMVPVDSEHSAIFQCLAGEPEGCIDRIILTASGGPFANATREEMAAITPERALDHPTWKMGRKITVDSATLMNKGLEILEAEALFGVEAARVDVVIHPKSIVHSLVRFGDGSVKAQLGLPDMRLPIQYALLYPERPDTGLPKLDLLTCGPLEFRAPDEDKFPCLRLARQAAAAGGTMPAIMCAADDVAVEAFLAGEIGFLKIADVVSEVMDSAEVGANPGLDAVVESDRWARERAAQCVRRMR